MIEYLEYKDHGKKWYIDKMHFGSLSLLVGISGVGKTQILRAVRTLASIANGEELNSEIEWEMGIKLNGELYVWRGKIQPETEDYNSFKFVEEKLAITGCPIFMREGTTILYKENRLPKLNNKKSLISLFTDEEEIQRPLIFFNNIHTPATGSDYLFGANFYSTMIDFNTKHITNLEILKSKNWSINNKLIIIEQSFPSTFQAIKEDFIDIFNQVEDFRFQYDQARECYSLEMKEKSSPWIPWGLISSGMLKTLLQIAEIHLCHPDSTLLIDEFENSLGVNCIDSLADIIQSSKNLQFIITSHHPYIINNIPIKNWKIITRKGNTIKALSPEDLSLGKSKHEAFKQLLNSEAYLEGIQ